MIMFSKIRIGLLSTALLITTAISAPALANSSPTLPELSPRQIAGDVRVITHPQSGQQDYILPSFDPFEDDPTLAGTAQLRTANNTVTIDGHNIRGGAVLDLTFYYNTNSPDPYDNRGYGDAAFLSGDYAAVTVRDSRILECSEDIQDVVYYHEDYYAPSFYSNLYRPYRHYSGFSDFGSRAYGGFSSFGYTGGSLLGRSFIGNRGFATRANTLRRDINRNRRINERRRDLEERLRDRRDANERVRDNRNRDNRNDARPRRRNNDRITNNERRDEGRPRRRLTEEQRRAVSARSADSAVGANNNTSSRRRNVRPNTGSQGVVSRRNSLRSDRRVGREIRVTNATIARTTPKQSSNNQVSQRKSSSKKTQNRSQNKSSKQARSTRNSQSRRKSETRNNNRNSRNRSNLRGARIIALGPMASLFGRRNIRKVSTQCAREEILSLHIPHERLEAARFDGLTVIVLDRTGHERPVYIPPNYIEGFRQATSKVHAGHPHETSRPRGYPAPSAPEPYQPNPNREQAPCPVGTTPQSDGTCLSTPVYSGYPTQ